MSKLEAENDQSQGLDGAREMFPSITKIRGSFIIWLLQKPVHDPHSL